MLIALGWLLLAEDGGRPDRPMDTLPASVATEDAVAATLPAVAETRTPPAELAPRARIDDVRGEPSPGLSQAPALVQGRLVAAGGSPLRGSGEVRAARPAAGFSPLSFTTDEHGTFAVAVPASAPLEVVLRASGMATRSAAVGRVEPGMAFGLGDVVMQPGRRVLGTVRDVDGAGIDGVLVALHREPRGSELRAPTRPLRTVEARSRGTGGLAFTEPLQPGRWRVFAKGLQEPKKVLTIEDVPSEFVLDVRVTASDPDAEVTGSVFDETGQPVERATVSLREVPRDGAGGVAASRGARELARELTRSDGGFTLRRDRSGADESAAMQLVVEANGYEPLVDPRPCHWGDREVRLHVQRASSLAVRVADRGGRAVEVFALHVFPPRPAGLEDLRARSRGFHADGLAHASGVRPGPQIVLVDLAGGLVQDGVLRFAHHGSAARFDVTVEPAVFRRVRVVGQDRRPVSGALVELLLPLSDAPITFSTPAAQLMDLWRRSGDRALRVVSRLSGTNGEAELSGHPATRYGLRVRGLGHACHLGEIVLGAAQDVTEVRLPQGGRVRVRIVPATFLTQAADRFREAPKPVLLHGRDGEAAARVEPVRASSTTGEFGFEHVDPGDYQVELSWSVRGHAAPLPVTPASEPRRNQPRRNETRPSQARRTPTEVEHRMRQVRTATAPAPARRPEPALAPGWHGTSSERRSVVLAAVPGLAEGETRDVVVQVHQFVLASLRGRVLNVPSDVGLAWLVPTEPGVGSEAALVLDDTGGFWVWLEPGRYRCELQGRHGKRVRAGDDEVVLGPGQAAERVFVADSVETSITVVDAAERPLAGAEVVLRTAGGEIPLPRTGDDGKVRATLRPGKYAAVLQGDVTEFEVSPGTAKALQIVARGKVK